MANERQKTETTLNIRRNNNTEFHASVWGFIYRWGQKAGVAKRPNSTSSIKWKYAFVLWNFSNRFGCLNPAVGYCCQNGDDDDDIYKYSNKIAFQEMSVTDTYTMKYIYSNRASFSTNINETKWKKREKDTLNKCKKDKNYEIQCKIVLYSIN